METKNKLRVGIIGATGMVGQRFITLLSKHPWYEIAALAASKSSSGKTYEEAVAGRWMMDTPIPDNARSIIVQNASEVDKVAALCDFVFCAVSLPKAETLALEESYAKAETPVISNNSAARTLADVPMLIPEINPQHAPIIEFQKKRLGTKSGFIAVKPNCSIQSYVPALAPLLGFLPETVIVSTYQAISGAGRTFETWPEMADNVIPYIGGEEEKSEQEPLKIWGVIDDGKIVSAAKPVISATCVRVAASDGHMASVSVKFVKAPSYDDIMKRWQNYEPIPQRWNLPSAPKPFIKYMEEADRPQTRLDRDFANGMGITIGRLRPDPVLDWRFVALSHNTLRGAAGGAVLMAELLTAEGYIKMKN
ncbi:MAG: aspartate-semialdehyde dehydrogenase [Oscillospiraceae bacterium]|jgi:aspartate-semialdehyde dehydrogenase|nr:aspartate-semialdehyde dehydrogenase [Oscillospiraceae bacterium]